MLIGELRWFYGEMAGEMGLRSNFMSLVNKLSGIYSSADPNSNIDGRIMAAASRGRKIARSLKHLSDDHNKTLYLYAQGHPVDPLITIMAHSPTAHDLWCESRSRRKFGDWLVKLSHVDGAPEKRVRTWLRIKSEARRQVDSALAAFQRSYGA